MVSMSPSMLMSSTQWRAVSAHDGEIMTPLQFNAPGPIFATALATESVDGTEPPMTAEAWNG